MSVVYTLTNGKRYMSDDFNSYMFLEKDGHLYNITKKKPKDLGMILYKEERNHEIKN